MRKAEPQLIQYQQSKGKDLNDTIEELVDRVRETGESFRLDVNGIVLDITPDAEVKEVVQQYIKKQRERDKIEYDQQEAEHIAVLPEAIEQGEAAIMEWVVAASHKYVFGKEKAAKIVEALERAGYQYLPDLDRSQREKDPTVLAKFVIGQAIDMLSEVAEIRMIGNSDLMLYRRLVAEIEKGMSLHHQQPPRGIAPREKPKPTSISPDGEHIQEAGEGNKRE